MRMLLVWMALATGCGGVVLGDPCETNEDCEGIEDLEDVAPRCFEDTSRDSDGYCTFVCAGVRHIDACMHLPDSNATCTPATPPAESICLDPDKL